MKRKVLCVFSFLFLLLVFCTLVGPKTEEEMLTLAQEKKAKAERTRHAVVGSISLDWENAKDTLFTIVEGEGWEEGLRISTLNSEKMEHGPAHAELPEGTEYRYVYSASREPIPGGEVRIVQQTWRGEDSYLIWSPMPFSDPKNLTNTMTIAAREINVIKEEEAEEDEEEEKDGGHEKTWEDKKKGKKGAALRVMNQSTLLIQTWGATFPFFEHSVWYRFRESIGPNARIYSLHDVEQFAQALPWLARLAAILVCSLLLWGAGWFLSRKREFGKGLWITNSLLIAAMYAAIPRLLTQFDLPASLMPRKTILDVSHYVQEFRRIIQCMDTMGQTTVREWLSQAGSACAVILCAGVLLTAAVIIAERHLCAKREKA